MHTIAAPRGLVGPTWGANPKLRLCQKILAVSNHPDQCSLGFLLQRGIINAVGVKLLIAVSYMQWGFKLLDAGFETCFGWDPRRHSTGAGILHAQDKCPIMNQHLLPLVLVHDRALVLGV